MQVATWTKPVGQPTMFDWLRYRYQLTMLQRARRYLQAQHHQEEIEAKKQNKSDLEIYDLYTKKEMSIAHQIASVETLYLCTLAEKYILPAPPLEDFELDHDINEVYLKPEAMIQLRSQIRTEQKERSDLARSWLSGITGLIGVLIGLLAIILGRR
jgi:hypothetical protein